MLSSAIVGLPDAVSAYQVSQSTRALTTPGATVQQLERGWNVARKGASHLDGLDRDRSGASEVEPPEDSTCPKADSDDVTC